MTSVIRVKRRIEDDPAEALVLSCKRQRYSAVTELPEIESVLSFAGTIKSKTEPVSRHIKEAIRQRKVEREIHPQSADYKHSHHIPDVTNTLRKQTKQASKANRYKVTSSKRALDLDLLDGNEDSKDLSQSSGSVSPQDQSDSRGDNKGLLEDGIISAAARKPDTSGVDQNKSGQGLENKRKNMIAKTTFEELLGNESQVKEDKMFCIFDLENEEESSLLKTFNQKSANGITLNNVPMVSKKTSSQPADGDQYVYDLYYTHNSLASLDPAAVLTVQALCEDFINEEQDSEIVRDEVCDESDDSNDESNWRNDYPDEDPRFFENEEEEYQYAEDMVDTNFLQDDDGDLLAYWMDTRCKVDGDSDNEEDEYENDNSDSDDSDDF